MATFSFLIVGAGRGGTSLLAGLLDAHSNLEVGFEKFSVKYLMNEQKCLFKQQLACRAHLFNKACIQEAKKYPNKQWGNKITTEQIAGLNETSNYSEEKVWKHFFEKELKNQKLVFILRDGRSCVSSKMERAGLSLESAIERWKYSVRMSQFLEGSQNSSISLKYEDLLTSPQTELKKICEFLKIDFESNMISGTNNPKMLSDYQQKGLNKEKATQALKQEDWHSQIKEELKSLNYL